MSHENTNSGRTKVSQITNSHCRLPRLNRQTDYVTWGLKTTFNLRSDLTTTYLVNNWHISHLFESLTTKSTLGPCCTGHQHVLSIISVINCWFWYFLRASTLISHSWRSYKSWQVIFTTLRYFKSLYSYSPTFRGNIAFLSPLYWLHYKAYCMFRS